ncbi:hypothetical protein ES703_44849 [subsurface metagenome]
MLKMREVGQLRVVLAELSRHAPFTGFGALTGIAFMVIIVSGGFLDSISPHSEDIFYVLHPAHVALSAVVTTAMYIRYAKGKIWMAILIGYTGALTIATLSDSIVPYLGETLLDLPNKGIHVGFIEKWWLVHPAALLGITIGCWKEATRFPHSGHVLISTWASSFHIVMALGGTLGWIQYLAISLFLFLAVWLPCCVSDIVYPLLFVRREPARIATPRKVWNPRK